MRVFSVTPPPPPAPVTGWGGGAGVFAVTFTASPEATRHFAVSWVRRVGGRCHPRRRCMFIRTVTTVRIAHFPLGLQFPSSPWFSRDENSRKKGGGVESLHSMPKSCILHCNQVALLVVKKSKAAFRLQVYLIQI